MSWVLSCPDSVSNSHTTWLPIVMSYLETGSTSSQMRSHRRRNCSVSNISKTVCDCCELSSHRRHLCVMLQLCTIINHHWSDWIINIYMCSIHAFNALTLFVEHIATTHTIPRDFFRPNPWLSQKMYQRTMRAEIVTRHIVDGVSWFLGQITSFQCFCGL